MELRPDPGVRAVEAAFLAAVHPAFLRGGVLGYGVANRLEEGTPVRKLSQGLRRELQGRGGLVAMAEARER